jgi:hypothetical protein
MMITKAAIARRAVLRGMGTALSLPLLESMIPALTAAPPSVNRLGAVYVPNGIVMDKWTPAAEGTAFEFTPTLKVLEPFRDQLLVLTGLNHNPQRNRPSAGNHSRASTRFLTDIQPKMTLGSDLEAGVSMDQIAAQEVGRHTQLASLELALESGDTAGGGDTGFSRAYTATISWRSATTPLPMEHNPRAIFERLFGDGGSMDRAARSERTQQDRSILDSIKEKLGSLQRKLGPGDRMKLTEYLEGIRDVERRILRTEATREFPAMAHPAGVPDTFEEHLKLMFDLYVLAFQCDLTRIITFMIGREFSGRTYPNLGIPDPHHALSHHQNEPERIAKLIKINTYHVELFSRFVEKMRNTSDGDGSLLDPVMLMYGAGMSDGNSHSPQNLPILLLGGGAGRLKGGQHIRYPRGTPLANLHVSLLNKLAVPVENFADSTGRLEELGI